MGVRICDMKILYIVYIADIVLRFLVALVPGGGGGVLPYIGYIGMCRGIGYGFSGSRSLNRVSFLLLLAFCSQCDP